MEKCLCYLNELVSKDSAFVAAGMQPWKCARIVAAGITIPQFSYHVAISCRGKKVWKYLRKYENMLFGNNHNRFQNAKCKKGGCFQFWLSAITSLSQEVS
jgi:hypothetical protein